MEQIEQSNRVASYTNTDDNRKGAFLRDFVFLFVFWNCQLVSFPVFFNFLKKTLHMKFQVKLI